MTSWQQCPNSDCAAAQIPGWCTYCPQCFTGLSSPGHEVQRRTEAKESDELAGDLAPCVNPQCGRRILSGSRFCTECGTRQHH